MSKDDHSPSEFVHFVRDVGVRSFDYMASKITDDASPFRKLAVYWSELEKEQKGRFFDQLISGAQVLAGSAALGKLATIKAKKKDKKKDDHKKVVKEAKKADGKKAKKKDKKAMKKKAKKAAKATGADVAIPSAS